MLQRKKEMQVQNNISKCLQKCTLLSKYKCIYPKCDYNNLLVKNAVISSQSSLVASERKPCACWLGVRSLTDGESLSPSLFRLSDRKRAVIWWPARLYETHLCSAGQLEREGRRQLQTLLLTPWQPLALREREIDRQREREREREGERR